MFLIFSPFTSNHNPKVRTPKRIETNQTATIRTLKMIIITDSLMTEAASFIKIATAKLSKNLFTLKSDTPQ